MKIFRKTIDSIKWIDLILIILNVGIGLAISKHLGYVINWITTVYFIMWILLFFPGNSIYWIIRKIDLRDGDVSYSILYKNMYQLLALLFFALSIMPMIQFLIVAFENIMVIYLFSILICWLISERFLEQQIKIFGLSESISAFMVSFIIPLIILNVNNIQIHEILLPISFFSFMQIIAYKLFISIIAEDKQINQAEIIPAYLGYYSIFRIISGVILFGYFFCAFQLILQRRMQLIHSLWLTLPIALFFVLKLFRIRGDYKKEAISLKPIANTLVFLMEIAWIFGLWIN